MQDGYRVQNACSNCKHCEVYAPQDDPYSYICNFNQDMPVPPMDQDDYWELTNEERSKIRDIFWKFRSTHEVIANGICDQWEKV